ncbi:MAG: hypothetical protein Q6373_022505 [Candidatus Sigynarchaeota archaeon]
MTETLFDAIGNSIGSPETAWSRLSTHKATRGIMIVVGLFSFSRLVTVILDVHRFALGGSLDQDTLDMILGTIARGSIWHSLVIASCGIAVIIAGCMATAVAISKAGRHGTFGRVFLELIVATTIRLPIIAGSALIALFLTGTVYITEDTASLATWIAGFAVALLEIWRVAGKVAARNEVRPRVGFIVAMLSSVIMAAITIGIVYLIGGLG